MNGSDNESFVSLSENELTEQISTSNSYEWDHNGFEFEIYNEEQEDNTDFEDIDELETEHISSGRTSDDYAILLDVETDGCMMIDFTHEMTGPTSSVSPPPSRDEQKPNDTNQSSSFDEYVVQQSIPWMLSPQDMRKSEIDTNFLFDEHTSDTKTKECIMNLIESVFIRFLLCCTTTLGTFTVRLRSRAMHRSLPKYIFPYFL